MKKEGFLVCLNCIDGRTHQKIFSFLEENYPQFYIDYITAPGLVGQVFNDEGTFKEAIISALNLSLKFHDPKLIVIAAHSDCAGNPVSDEEQVEMLRQAKESLRKTYNLEVKAIFLRNNSFVEEI